MLKWCIALPALHMWLTGVGPWSPGEMRSAQPAAEDRGAPYVERAEVSVVAGGWIVIGLERDAECAAWDADLGFLSDRAWFFLAPTNPDFELVNDGACTWLVPRDQAVEPERSAGMTGTRQPVMALQDECVRELLITVTGVATFTVAPDGAVTLVVEDDNGTPRFSTVFRFAAEAPDTGASGEQSTTCSANCDNGGCSVTCTGKQALCTCNGGDPECRCGRKLTIAIEPLER